MIHILLPPTFLFPLEIDWDLISTLFYRFLSNTCSKSVVTCCHFPWTSAFVSEHLCDSYMFLLIHNSNVRNIQVCDCICAELSCEIDAEQCASLLFVLRVMSSWVFLNMITLSICCNSAVIWKASNKGSDLERRRRRWSIISQAELFFWSNSFFLFFPNFQHATNLIHHVLLYYAYDIKYKLMWQFMR